MLLIVEPLAAVHLLLVRKVVGPLWRIWEIFSLPSCSPTSVPQVALPLSVIFGPFSSHIDALAVPLPLVPLPLAAQKKGEERRGDRKALST